MKYIFLILISALLAICPYIYPMEGDDFIYSFTMNAASDRVVDFAGVLEGTANCFRYVNGRTLTNFLIFLFVNLIPQWGMYILAFLTFLLTLTLLAPLSPAVSIRAKAYPSALFISSLTAILFWLFCPDIYDTLMWKSGFMNYALPGALTLLFLHLLSPSSPAVHRKANASLFFLPLFSFLTASLHEGASLPISGALIVFSILNLRALTTRHLLAIIPYILGTLLILLTPGTTARVGLASAHTFHFLPFIQTLIHNIPSLTTTILLFITIWLRRKHTHPVLYFLNNTIPLTAILFSFILYLLISITSGTPEPRYFFFAHLLSLYLLLPLLSTTSAALAQRWQKNFPLFAFRFSFPLLLILLITLSIHKTCQKKSIADQEFLLFSQTTDFVVPSDFTDLTSDTTLYSNRLIAKYFHKPYLIAYPSPIYHHLYLHEDAPLAPFSQEWHQLSPSIFARKLTSPSTSPLTLTYTYNLPLLSALHRHTEVTPQIIHSKQGIPYQVIQYHKPHTTITSLHSNP